MRPGIPLVQLKQGREINAQDRRRVISPPIANCGRTSRLGAFHFNEPMIMDQLHPERA